MTKFNYIGPVNGTGYGIASQGYLKQLLELSPDLGFKLIGKADNKSLDPAKLEAAQNNFDPSAPSFCFWHLSHITHELSECTGPKVGMTTFEIDTFKTPELEALGALDAVCTASNWGKGVIEAHTRKDAQVIPHAFKEKDTDHIPQLERGRSFIEDWEKFLDPIKLDPETLILSANGKYESRKGYPELLDACIEYGKTKPVLLVGFFFNPFIPDNFPYSDINSKFLYPFYTKSGVKAFKRGKFILVLMPPTAGRPELFGSLSKADFFMAPSKGEGWNLPLFEMMSFGMPSIATLNTAHTDFCSEKTVIPIADQAKLIKASDGKFFDGTGRWYDVRSSDIVEGMKLASQLKTDSNKLAALGSAAHKKASEFSWEKSAKMILKLMESL